MNRKIKKFYTQEEINNKEYEKDGINKDDIIIKWKKCRNRKRTESTPRKL